MGFTKLDERILQSSIMSEDPEVFKVWIFLLAACKEDGVAEISPVYISSVGHLKIDSVVKALDKLGSPDLLSRSTNDDGRRIERINGGFRIINYDKYRERSLKSAEAERKRIYRKEGPKHRDGYIYFAKAGDIIKIGFSDNPWARIKDLKISSPNIVLIGVKRGTMLEERLLHEKYSDINVGGEWFKKDKKLLDDIESIISSPDSSNSSPDSSASSSSYSSKEEEVKEKGKKKFQKPSIEEITEYCKSRSNNVDPQKFFDYYESKGWVVGKSPMKNWQAAVRTWEKNGFNSQAAPRKIQYAGVPENYNRQE